MRLEAPGSFVRRNWDRLAGLPGGRWLFSRVLSVVVPYSGTVRPQVLELGAGHCRIAMRDRRGVRNHLGSVHAIALANLAELTSGLAVSYALPAEARGIPVELKMEYVKKGRGRLIGSCDTTIPDWREEGEHTFGAEIRDDGGELVAKAEVRWRIGPREAR